LPAGGDQVTALGRQQQSPGSYALAGQQPGPARGVGEHHDVSVHQPVLAAGVQGHRAGRDQHARLTGQATGDGPRVIGDHELQPRRRPGTGQRHER
jgi:hypothetical protein